jgi:type III secretory pathway component EscS
MLSLLLEASIRATLIALAIALVLLAMRVRQTTLRHAVWTVVVVIMLFLPVRNAWRHGAGLIEARG